MRQVLVVCHSIVTVWSHRVALAAVIVTAVACASDPSAPVNRPYDVAFDAMWNAFDAQYPYFEYKQVDWSAQQTTYRGQAASAASIDEFVAAVHGAVEPLRDAHVWFEDPVGAFHPTYTATAFVNWDQTVWLAYMTGTPYSQVRPSLATTEVGGVPYLSVGAWNDAQISIADLDAALERFRGRTSLIIDVRPNSGGDDGLALALAERFTTTSVTGEYLQTRTGPRHGNLSPEQPRTIAARGSWQFTGRVYVLAGRRSASSTETFVAFMQEIPGVTVVGDTTAGESGNPAPVELTGGWKIWMPRWLVRTAQHRIVEWQGIPPGIVVPATAADFAAGRDPVLDYAVAALRSGP